MKYLSLFSGIGGFELGIQKAYEENNRLSLQGQNQNLRENITNDKGKLGTATCVGYSEIDKYAIQVYNKHFNHKNYGDATKIDTRELPDFDLLVGGFPCQAFSIAGKRRGFDEARGTLFFDIARILADKKPRNFILENVKGLLSHDGGATFTTIIRILSSMGYFVEWQVLNAKDFGVPQNRERVFIVGHLGGQPRRKVFPIIGTGSKDIIVNGVLNTETWRKRHEQIRRTHDIKGISPTLPTGTGGGVMTKIKTDLQVRRLTPLECERLMAYPDNWTAEGTEGKISDTQRYKMCGNGIVSNVVEEIIKRI
jgi:DNA (cytosine-5)-methyltransferase 1